MATLTPERKTVQVEETQFRFAVSEALAQKIGANSNFINFFQYDTKAYFFNGKYDVVAAPQTGVDGLYVTPFDVEIHGVIMFNLVAGTAGTTTLDVHRLTGPGVDAGSIFSTRPAIDSTAANDSYVGFIINPSTGAADAIGGGTGMTQAVLTSGATTPFNLDAGDALRVDFDAKMADAENAGLILYIRPR